jgi:hypothetical protein
MSENRALKRIYGPKREEIVAGCRKQHNVKLHNLYASQNIIRLIKSRRMKGVELITRMGETKNTY